MISWSSREISLYVFDQHNDIQYTFEAGEKRDDNSEEHSLQEEKRKVHIEKMDLLRKQITDISSSHLALFSSELPLLRSKVARQKAGNNRRRRLVKNYHNSANEVRQTMKNYLSPASSVNLTEILFSGENDLRDSARLVPSHRKLREMGSFDNIENIDHFSQLQLFWRCLRFLD